MKEDGSFDHTRFEKAPDDLKGAAKEFGRYKSLDELFKGHVELRALASKKGIAEPLGKDATPEQRAEHMALVKRALGVPDKPEGYVVEWPKELPEAMRDTKAVGEFAKLAHEEGISPAAFQKAVNLEISRQAEAQAAYERQTKEMWEGQDKLMREALAKEGLDYGKGIDAAERAAKRFFGIDRENPLFKNATVVAGLARLGKGMAEGKLVQGDTSDDALKQHTPETALASANAIRDDRSNPKWFAFWNRDPENPKKEKVHPDHDAVVSEVKRLTALAYASRPMRGQR